MREREKILNSFDAGESNGVLDAVALELTLEVLLDIRDVLVDFYNRDSDVKIEYSDKRKL